MSKSICIARASRLLRPVFSFTDAIKLVKLLSHNASTIDVFDFISKLGIDCDSTVTGICDDDDGHIGFIICSRNSHSCRIDFCCTGWVLLGTDGKIDPWFGSIR